MSGAPKILIVDDSMMIRMTVKRTLEKAGFIIVEAKDGVEGLEQAKLADDFDLILTDLNMPNMDGLEMISEIRKISCYKDSPIVMLTTESGEDKKQDGHKHGVSSWLIKPFNPDQLIELVGGMLF